MDKNNDKIFKRKADIQYKNMNMYNYIITKNNIPKTQYRLINIDKDGNCFYKCVSNFLYWTIAYHREIMNAISKCLQGKLRGTLWFSEESWNKKR